MSKGAGRELIGFIPILIFAILALILLFYFNDTLARAIIDSIKAIIKIVEVK